MYIYYVYILCIYVMYVCYVYILCIYIMYTLGYIRFLSASILMVQYNFYVSIPWILRKILLFKIF